VRDNFYPATKRSLMLRVNGRCSNPICGKATSGPNSDKNKSVNIGKAAHICAASPGGPRYDPNMTSAERSDIDNGIWLCSVCADLVDKDVMLYTKELLRRWKKNAENIAWKNISHNKAKGYGKEVNGKLRLEIKFIEKLESIFSDNDVKYIIKEHDFRADYAKSWLEPLYDLLNSYKDIGPNFLDPKFTSCFKTLMENVCDLRRILAFGGGHSKKNSYMSDDHIWFCVDSEEDRVKCNDIARRIWYLYNELVDYYRDFLHQ